MKQIWFVTDCPVLVLSSFAERVREGEKLILRAGEAMIFA